MRTGETPNNPNETSAQDSIWNEDIFKDISFNPQAAQKQVEEFETFIIPNQGK